MCSRSEARISGRSPKLSPRQALSLSSVQRADMPGVGTIFFSKDLFAGSPDPLVEPFSVNVAPFVPPCQRLRLQGCLTPKPGGGAGGVRALQSSLLAQGRGFCVACLGACIGLHLPSRDQGKRDAGRQAPLPLPRQSGAWLLGRERDPEKCHFFRYFLAANGDNQRYLRLPQHRGMCQ